MRLSVADNLRATESREQWVMKEFAFFYEGTWREAPHRDNVQAFEEKFNSFLMSPALPAPVYVVRQRQRDVPALAGVGRATLVQSRRHAYTSSWYIREPRRWAGLAAYKAFGVEGDEGTYTFELIALGSDDSLDGVGPLSTEAMGRSAFDLS